MIPTANDRPYCVIGAGSWGTALALALAANGHAVRLWAHRPEHAAALAADRENKRYLPGIAFPENIQPYDDLTEASLDAELLVVVPSHAFADTLRQLPNHIPRIAWATKGLEAGSGGFLHQVAVEILGDIPMAVLSGPSFAGEVARHLPTAVTIAARDTDYADLLANAFHSDAFRVYTSTDVVGVELGGSVKNVLAIATGVSDGMGFGANARAALITRGLAELTRLGAAVGADPITLMGLSGVGDLILTCTDNQSRNRRMGLALGEGKSIEEAQQAIGQTVEGLRTAKQVHDLAATRGVDMPICEQVYRLVKGDVSARDALHNLMGRAQKSEFDV